MAKILLVEDNEMNRDMLSRRLERQGYCVALAENGREALAMARAQPYDLILLDMMMPEMNGYEVLQVWMADDALRDIPVIIVSALDEVDSVARCVELGAADYLTKPFNAILLHARIEACLEKKWLRDQEIEYLRNVALLTDAAASVETGAFEPQTIAAIAARGEWSRQSRAGFPADGARGGCA
jgi:DNA-binding response OmpR family regulator